MARSIFGKAARKTPVAVTLDAPDGSGAFFNSRQHGHPCHGPASWSSHWRRSSPSEAAQQPQQRRVQEFTLLEAAFLGGSQAPL